MPAADRNTQPAVDPFDAVRALNRMKAAGFTLRMAGGALQVAPFSRLSADQVGYLVVF
jgi:hypothetical protein